ncbi:MAG: 4Fe-4S dicluster domain-containing protein [Bacteroidales bacterium]
MAFRINPEVTGTIESLGNEDMEKCYNCGNCVAICPMDLDILPRRIFRHALFGFHDKLVEEKEPIFSCLLCKRCEESCPEGVAIADNIRLLRYYLIREEFKI